MLNDETEVYNAAAYYVGVNKCTEDSKEAQKILDVLEAQKPFVATYNSDGTIDRLAAGEVLAHMQWNGASHRTKEKLPTAVYVYPEERSEERRVGNECVSTCRSSWSRYH